MWDLMVHMVPHPPNPLIKLARIGARLTRVQLARRAGINVRYLRRLENGDGAYTLSPTIAQRIAAVLEIPADALFPKR